MPINNFTVGKDLSFTLATANGTLDLSGVTDYSTKQMQKDLSHTGLDGVTEHGIIPGGWQISIKLDREDAVLDNYFAAREADYYAGINVPGGTIYETIKERDGSISQYRYTGVVLKYEDAGSWKGDSYVPVGLTAMATRRIKVA